MCWKPSGLRDRSDGVGHEKVKATSEQQVLTTLRLEHFALNSRTGPKLCVSGFFCVTCQRGSEGEQSNLLGLVVTLETNVDRPVVTAVLKVGRRRVGARTIVRP